MSVKFSFSKSNSLNLLAISGLLLLLIMPFSGCGEATLTPANQTQSTIGTSNQNSVTPTTTLVSTVPATIKLEPSVTRIPIQSTTTNQNPTTTALSTVTATTNPNVMPTRGQSNLNTTMGVITTSSGQTINMRLELAVTPQEQGTGLMGRTSLLEDSGMLFIFPQKVNVGFWMKDTLIPLSIAWIDEKGTILEIQDMEAQSEAVHVPAQTYIWALEVPKGYFDKKGIKLGSSLKLQTP